MIQSREFAPQDMEAVLAIAAASPEAAAWNRQGYEQILAHSGNSFCRVAEQDGGVVGFVCFRVVEGEAELLNLAVLPSFRRRGIGAFLVSQALREVADKGAKRIFLEVRDSNFPALRLYECLGFEPVGRRPAYYTNPPADALVLQRGLTRQPGMLAKMTAC
ncbi:MAG: ribosomal protein S18-alanine N-acetyltransferase [Acidobacteria bacterium]|nr:ribosomal protein S18-alanine N-acetyltransferase [Acidobacteriota bacterium]